MDKRCLIITYYFPPMGGGGVQRILKLVKYLRPKGWQFTLITASPYPKAAVLRDTSLLDETPSDLKVIRVPDSMAALQKGIAGKLKSTFAMRWISSLFFIPDIRKNWVKQAEKKALALLDRETFDCILISSPPYSLALCAARLQKQTQIPVILDMRDAWTTNPYKIYPSSLHSRIDAHLERKAIKNVKYGVSCIASLIEHFKKNIPDFKTENWRVIPNGFDESDFSGLQKTTCAPGCFNIAFSGTTYSHLNSPEPLFKAIAHLAKEQPHTAEKIRFHHVGHSVIDLKKLSQKYNLEDQIVLHGYHPHRVCLNILSGMDALIFFLDSRDPRSVNTLGGKVYEYLRLELPVIGVVPRKGEAADLLTETGAGLVTPGDNPQELAEVLLNLINGSQRLKRNAHIIRRYERRVIADDFKSFFEEVCRASAVES